MHLTTTLDHTGLRGTHLTTLDHTGLRGLVAGCVNLGWLLSLRTYESNGWPRVEGEQIEDLVVRQHTKLQAAHHFGILPEREETADVEPEKLSDRSSASRCCQGST